ncbi:hypothetical protein [Pseudoalteromonas sp. McH1-42]|uniref:hypothetical protein n=1 Tax=Pseudoalteromonas sp. McH1-42 TaxID=2917752 RepID=UPI001EF56F44|nr:hypothetical protein [Pseudoalteromonas sp. McH1-42]MCG7561167.1 hypothetical protein [Pseudoalteromonas sp. McH1-42]
MALDYEEIRGVSCMVVRENGKFFVSYDSGAQGSRPTVQQITERDFNAVKSGSLSVENVMKRYHYQ